MRKNYNVYLLIFGLLISVNAKAQLVSSFDDLSLSTESYWNGSDGTGSFTSGQAIFKNSYNADWGSWSGFAYSNVTDNLTAGYTNQYSAIAGSGVLSSANYAVCYAGSSDSISFPDAKDLVGMYVTNSTYAALSMKLGDDFSKKFGGESGNDPDWFLLTIEGFNANREVVGTVEFYMADYRFENSADDYIVEDWQMIDLSTLKGISFLTFSLTSSDNGDWGMNTPGYFCFDDLTIENINSIKFSNGPIVSLNIYPNPASDFVIINAASEIQSIVIYNLSGQQVLQKSSSDLFSATVLLDNIKKGAYLIEIKTANGIATKQLIKK